MTALKKGDFVTVSYTGRLQNTQVVFDTTDAQVAKKSGIFSDKKSYEPVIVCVGEAQIMESIDKNLEGKQEKSTFTLSLAPELAYGKKNPQLIKLISSSKFEQDKIAPHPGLQVFVNNQIGIVKSVSSGRVMVDFNHPLAGKDVDYDVTVGEKVTDVATQIQALVKLQFKNGEVTFADNKATITLPIQMPAEYAKVFESQIKRMIPSIGSVAFVVKAQK